MSDIHWEAVSQWYVKTLQTLAFASDEMVVISSVKAVVIRLIDTATQVLRQGNCANCCSVIPELLEILKFSLLIPIISRQRKQETLRVADQNEPLSMCVTSDPMTMGFRGSVGFVGSVL